ncbi:MAG TPA: ABC transporter permease, partial [Chitinophaga sp.]
MFKNYLLVALRNISRNKAFSFLNILGLALGMVCSLLIMLWVNDERKIDKFHEHAPHLYSVYQRQYYDGAIEASRATPAAMPDEMKRVLPEVQYATGISWDDENTFQVKEKILKKKGNHAGADFFKMFSFPLLEGDIATALNKPGSIAVSRKMASDFFGSPRAAIGKTIRYENNKDLLITAVFEDIPENSSMKFDYLIDWFSFLKWYDWVGNWGNNGPQTYLQLSAGTDAAAFEKKIVRFLDGYNKEQGPGFRQELGIQRYDDIYLHAGFSKTGTLEGGRIAYVRLFSIVAFFILLIACINFMNLTTARSVKRSKEIGVRKVIGAFRLALVRQFMAEAVLLSFISIAAAIGIVVLCLPAFNMLTGKEMIFPSGSVSFWLSIIGLALITGVIAGSYPSFFLSSFNPVTVMKGALKSSPAASWFRKGLVVFQFVLSIILIIGTIVVSGQIRFIQTTNLGFERENLIYIPLEGDLTGKYQLFKEKALNMPGIQLVSRISQT